MAEFRIGIQIASSTRMQLFVDSHLGIMAAEVKKNGASSYTVPVRVIRMEEEEIPEGPCAAGRSWRLRVEWVSEERRCPIPVSHGDTRPRLAWSRPAA